MEYCILKVYDLVLKNGRLKMHEIARIVGISKDRGCWVPHLLTTKGFLHRFEIVDEIWMESREQSKQWTLPRANLLREGEGLLIIRKADCRHFLQFTKPNRHTRTLHEQWQNDHRVLLCWIVGPIRLIAVKATSFGEKKMNFHHNKAPAHTCAGWMLPIQRILQIWPRVTCLCFPTWEVVIGTMVAHFGDL